MRVVKRPYHLKKYRLAPISGSLIAGPALFNSDLHIFNKELAEKYDNDTRTNVIIRTNELIAERIIYDLWRMPIPSGLGLLYMFQLVNSKSVAKNRGWMRASSDSILAIKDTFRSVKLRHNRDGRIYKHQRIYGIKVNKGYFQTMLKNAIMDSLKDPTIKKYKGHIV